eukprot:gene4332-6133_t
MKSLINYFTKLLLLLGVMVLPADGHATLMTSSYCSRSLSAGTTIMSKSAVISTTRTLVIKRGSTTLTSGASYVAGESLTVSISSTSGEYLFEASNAQFSSGSCTDNVRIANSNGATLVMPTSGTVLIRAGWTTSYTTVNIISDFTLVAATTSSPSYSPSSAPTAISSLRPTTNLPTITPTGLPSVTLGSPTAAPSIQTTMSPTIAVTNIPTTYPSRNPTVLTTSAIPSSAPTPSTATLIRYDLVLSMQNTTKILLSKNNAQSALVKSLRTSISNYLDEPYNVECTINSTTTTTQPSVKPTIKPSEDDRRILIATTTVSVPFEIQYILQNTKFNSSTSLYSSLLDAVQSSNKTFLSLLQAYNIAGLKGIQSISVQSLSTGDVTYIVNTAVPTSSPTAASQSTNTGISSGVKQILGVIIAIGGFFILLIGGYSMTAGLSHYLFANALIATISGIASIALISAWATAGTSKGYLGLPSWSNNVFAWHPVLMVAGFFFCQVISNNVLILMDTSPSHSLFWSIAAFSCMVAGLCAIVKYKFDMKHPSLISLHSWIGLSAIVLFLVSLTFQIILRWMKRDTSTLAEHSSTKETFLNYKSYVFVAMIPFGLTIFAILTGISNQLTQSNCSYILVNGSYKESHYNHLSSACRIANGLGIMTIISSICTVIVISYMFSNEMIKLSVSSSSGDNENVVSPSTKNDIQYSGVVDETELQNNISYPVVPVGDAVVSTHEI